MIDLVNIALIQMVSSRTVRDNLQRAECLIQEAAKADVQAIFLPENFLALASLNPLQIGLDEINPDGPGRRFLSEMAVRTNCWIFGGTLPVACRPDGSPVPEGRVRAASIVVDPSGREVARYDKIHMFDVVVDDAQKNYVESKTFEPGQSLERVNTPFGVFGLSVCYDIRFPELYRQLQSFEVRCIAIPSAFTAVTGAAHFEILMRARAIENACFTIAACQGGVHDSGRVTYGNSMVVNPWGEVISRADLGEQVVFAQLDYQQQDILRRDMPVHAQRRL